jgi:hypothetical protein
MIAVICCTAIASSCNNEHKAMENKAMEHYAMKAPLVAPSKEEILGWMRKQGQSYRALEYDHQNKNILVLLVQVGFGMPIEEIFVYGKSEEQSEWALILYRPTDTKVEVREGPDRLSFCTIAGDIIIEQSFDTIGPLGETARRKRAEKLSGVSKP